MIVLLPALEKRNKLLASLAMGSVTVRFNILYFATKKASLFLQLTSRPEKRGVRPNRSSLILACLSGLV